MKLLLGLGNPGIQYAETRHNIGFSFLDFIAKQQGATWKETSKFKATIAELTIHSQKVMLVKPATFYNLVGESARTLRDFYKLTNEDILVIHDELDLPFGTIRTRSGGSSAGNNGIKNLISHLGEDFNRVRVGIANDHSNQQEAMHFVLDRFDKTEKEKLSELFEHIEKLADNFIDETKEFVHHSMQIK